MLQLLTVTCMLFVPSNKGKGMQSSSEQPLVVEERYVTTEIMAAKEINVNGDSFVIIASSLHPSLLTEHSENRLVEEPLKKTCKKMKINCCAFTLSLKP